MAMALRPSLTARSSASACDTVRGTMENSDEKKEEVGENFT